MSPTTPSPTAPPLSVPGLELQEKIGEGGTGVVYRAVHCTLQRTVAVKLLPASAGSTTSPAWLREPRLMASLAHPHVVVIHDAGQVESHNFLVMECMGGGSLRGKMTPGRPWPLAEAAPLLDSVAQAVSYIHERGVLHLDLKPENILYTTDGEVKVTDFGLSVPHADANGILGNRQFQGTIDYCAPEYRAGLGLDARFDVFSLATLAYELLTGRLPGRVYVPASCRNPRLPRAIDEVLRRGLAREPDERYASVAEFRQALADGCRPTRRRISLRVLGAAAALAVVVTGLLVAFGWRPGAPRTTALPKPEPPGPQSPSAERLDRLVVLYDKRDDLSLFAGENGGELTSGSTVPVERVTVTNPPGPPPAGLPLPVWPMPRPVLVIHSPQAWGFVHPLTDRSLGQRVVAHWAELLRTVVPPGMNLVKAGGFDGDCLVKSNDGALWRAGTTADWSASRQITLDRPQSQTDNPTLLLTNLDPARSKVRLRCYQPLSQGPPPGAVMVLRFRARSLHARGNLAVCAVMPAEIPEGDTSPAASRVRSLATPVPPGHNDPVPNRWLYWAAAPVAPTTEWQTYLVVSESPPFPTRVLHRNLVIDLTATPSTATDQVWVDDVELFAWQPGGKP